MSAPQTDTISRGFSCPLLGEEEVHLWCADLDRSRWQEKAMLDTLSEEERLRAARFRLATDRRRFVASHGLQRCILAGYLECAPRDVRYAYGRHGKPSLASTGEPGPLRFNMSHSRALALYALARGREVGVDLEFKRPLADVHGLARTIFPPAAMGRFTALRPEHRQEAFFQGWTRKEAFVKATGEGLGGGSAAPGLPIPAGDTAASSHSSLLRAAGKQWSLYCFEPAPGYVAALVAEGRGHTMHHLNELMTSKGEDE